MAFVVFLILCVVVFVSLLFADVQNCDYLQTRRAADAPAVLLAQSESPLFFCFVIICRRADL